MDRFTKVCEVGDGQVTAYVIGNAIRDLPTATQMFVGDAINRLAAYEDTELTPEEVAELAPRNNVKVCTEHIVNRGIGVSGEYDIDAHLLCPACGAVVGDAEYGEIDGNFCHNCGQRIAAPINA